METCRSVYVTSTWDEGMAPLTALALWTTVLSPTHDFIKILSRFQDNLATNTMNPYNIIEAVKYFFNHTMQ